MTLDQWDRKRLLPYGAVTEVANRIGVSRSLVSEVIRGTRRNRNVEVALARVMKLPVDEAFGPPRRRARLVAPAPSARRDLEKAS
jgi:hypothetical protein